MYRNVVATFLQYSSESVNFLTKSGFFFLFFFLLLKTEYTYFDAIRMKKAIYLESTRIFNFIYNEPTII